MAEIAPPATHLSKRWGLAKVSALSAARRFVPGASGGWTQTVDLPRTVRRPRGGQLGGTGPLPSCFQQFLDHTDECAGLEGHQQNFPKRVRLCP